MNDVALKEHNLIQFPKNLGITSKTFFTQRTIAINNFKDRPVTSDFTQAVDNPKGIQTINNFIIGAIKT